MIDETKAGAAYALHASSTDVLVAGVNANSSSVIVAGTWDGGGVG
jgi:hypothetical protein